MIMWRPSDRGSVLHEGLQEGYDSARAVEIPVLEDCDEDAVPDCAGESGVP